MWLGRARLAGELPALPAGSCAGRRVLAAAYADQGELKLFKFTMNARNVFNCSCAMLRYSARCCAMLRYAVLCCAMLRYAALCCAMLRYAARLSIGSMQWRFRMCTRGGSGRRVVLRQRKRNQQEELGQEEVVITPGRSKDAVFHAGGPCRLDSCEPSCGRPGRWREACQ